MRNGISSATNIAIKFTNESLCLSSGLTFFHCFLMLLLCFKWNSGENKLFWRHKTLADRRTLDSLSGFLFFLMTLLQINCLTLFFLSLCVCACLVCSQILLSHSIFFSSSSSTSSCFLLYKEWKRKKKHNKLCLLSFGDDDCLHYTKCVWPLVEQKKTESEWETTLQMQELEEKSAKWVWLHEIIWCRIKWFDIVLVIFFHFGRKGKTWV